MPETILDSLTRLIRYQRSPDAFTSQFRSMKHNSDLLPKLQLQLETILAAHGKFRPIVYDTQGIKDDGSDLLLRTHPEDGVGKPDLICFQVKSFNDLAQKSYMQDLKAQRDDSFRKVIGMRQYFVMLCTDGSAHKDKVRTIMAEFRSAERTEVIEPAYAYTFLHHPKTRVDAFVKRTMEAGDLVFRQAYDSLPDSSPSARALAIFMIARTATSGVPQFSEGELLQEPVLLRWTPSVGQKIERP